MLDPGELRAFTCLAEELHFGRTAERLHMSQSTLSVQIQRLEDQVGAPLVTRGRRAPVRLTDVGHVFLAEARQVLEQLARAETVGRLAARGEAGELDIGYVFSAALDGGLTRLLNIIRSAAPSLDLIPRMLETPKQIAAVAHRRLDLGLCRPRLTYPSGVQARIIGSEPFGLLVRADHALAAVDDAHPADLRDETFLLPHFNERHGLLERLEQLAAVGGFHLRAPIRTSDYMTAAALAGSGYGIVLGPESLAGLGLAPLTFVPVVGFDPIETILVWHEEASPFVTGLAARLTGDA